MQEQSKRFQMSEINEIEKGSDNSSLYAFLKHLYQSLSRTKMASRKDLYAHFSEEEIVWKVKSSEKLHH